MLLQPGAQGSDSGVEFLRGTATSDDCKPIFEQYEKCLSVSHLEQRPTPNLTVQQKALGERGIDKMLKEVRDDNRENDAEHMKPVSLSIWPIGIEVDGFQESVMYDHCCLYILHTIRHCMAQRTRYGKYDKLPTLLTIVLHDRY